MSKWIDAEWLMNFFVDIPDNFTLTIGNLRATVNEAPSIDIVRCKECKWYDLNAHECTGEVNSTDHEGGASYSLNFYDDDFCSYGERREP